MLVYFKPPTPPAGLSALRVVGRCASGGSDDDGRPARRECPDGARRTGLLVLLGVAPTTGDLRRRAALAPLTGMAAVGLIGATIEPFHVGIGPLTLFLLAAASLAVGFWRLRARPHAARAAAWTTVDRPPSCVGRRCSSRRAIASLPFGQAARRVRRVGDVGDEGSRTRRARLGRPGGLQQTMLFDGPHLEYPLLVPVLHAVGIRSAGSLRGPAGRPAVPRDRTRRIARALRDLQRPSATGRPAADDRRGRSRAGRSSSNSAPATRTSPSRSSSRRASRHRPVGSSTEARPGSRSRSSSSRAAALTKNEGLLYACAALAGSARCAEGHVGATSSRRVAVVALAILPWRLRVRSRRRRWRGLRSATPLALAASTSVDAGSRGRGSLLGYATDTRPCRAPAPARLGLAWLPCSSPVGATSAASFAGVRRPLILGSHLDRTRPRRATSTCTSDSAPTASRPRSCSVAAAVVPLLLEELALSRRRDRRPRPESSSG